MKIGDLVLLDEDMAFQVVNVVDYNGESYLFGFKAPKQVSEVFDTDSLKNFFLKEIVEEETDECFVEEVEDKALIKILIEQIAQMNGLKK